MTKASLRQLIEDDRSRFLEAQSSRERRPQHVANKLINGGSSFAEEEIKLAKAIFSPKNKK